MPKRRNPFGECSPLQLKQHVGIKEVDLGVAQEQKMKSVYGRPNGKIFYVFLFLFEELSTSWYHDTFVLISVFKQYTIYIPILACQWLLRKHWIIPLFSSNLLDDKQKTAHR